MRTLILLVLTLLATACTGIPPGHQVVKPFQLDRYLGTWYEIARLDHGFERGLSRVTASYSLRDDGVSIHQDGVDGISSAGMG